MPAPILVPGDRVLQMIQTYHDPSTITNVGNAVCYISGDSQVSPDSYDFAILPGASIQWREDTPFYAIAGSPLESTYLIMTIKVSAVTMPASAAQPNADVLFYDNREAIPEDGWDVSAYASISVYIPNAYEDYEVTVTWADDGLNQNTVAIDYYRSVDKTLGMLNVKAPWMFLSVIGGT